MTDSYDVSEGPSSRSSRRRTKVVNYVALNGGSDDEDDRSMRTMKREKGDDVDFDDSEDSDHSPPRRLPNSLKRRLFCSPSGEAISAKKATVHLSVASPSTFEFVNDSSNSSRQTNYVKKRVLVSSGQGQKASRLILCGRQEAVGTESRTTSASAAGGRTILVRLPDGSTGTRLIMNKGNVNAPQSSGDRRSFLVRLPNGRLGIVGRSVQPVRATVSPVKVEEDPYREEDEEFMNEVNKFLDSSMSLHSGRPMGGGYLGSEYIETEDFGALDGPLAGGERGLTVSAQKSSPVCPRKGIGSSARTVGRSFTSENTFTDEETSRQVDSISCDMCGSSVGKKGLKMHSKTCKGIIVKWRPEDEAEQGSTRECPRCNMMFTVVKDFEVHMAVEHKFFWRLDFASEDEFKKWFLDEGLDETTIAGPSKTHKDIHEKVFYCAISGGQRMKVKCPCRLVVKKSPAGITVRYFPSHNHAERVVRQQMPNEARELILTLLRKNLKNSEILRALREAYPESSVNRSISALAITRLRCRYFRPPRSPDAKPETRGRKRKVKLRPQGPHGDRAGAFQAEPNE